ncbi:MAG: hypothetical protein ABRQ38_17690 [Candidatus Eremiobacterota bacterium]
MNLEEEIICRECGRKCPEKFAMCSGCEDYFCYKDGCNWISKKKGLFICENCSPEESHAKFIIDPSLRNLRIERQEEIIAIGDYEARAIEILKSRGYVEKYRLDKIKYGKNCGLYFLSDSEAKISGIGVWSGLHETDRGIGIYSPEEDVIKVYGENFTAESSGKYTTFYHYKDFNLIFKLAKTGEARKVVTEIILI